MAAYTLRDWISDVVVGPHGCDQASCVCFILRPHPAFKQAIREAAARRERRAHEQSQRSGKVSQ